MAKAAAAAPVPIDVIGPGTPEPGPLRGGRPFSISAAVSCSEICDRPPRRIIEKQSSCVMPSASERHSVVEGRPVGVLRAAEARARGCPQRREREPAAGRSSWNRSQFGQGRVDARRRETLSSYVGERQPASSASNTSRLYAVGYFPQLGGSRPGEVNSQVYSSAKPRPNSRFEQTGQ